MKIQPASRSRAVVSGVGASWLCAVLAILGACDGGRSGGSFGSAGPATVDAPNVVLITVDTLRADALGAYGRADAATPNIDRLAEGGTLFEQTTASAPSTLPSHASILTGKHPFTHGARANSGYVLPKENVTLAEVLRAEGWRTAAESAAPVIGRRTQLDQGFEQYRDLDSFDVTLNRAERPDSTIVEFPERPGADISRFAIDYISGHQKERFFLWLHYFEPHAPYTPPSHLKDPNEHPYRGEVSFADEQIGRVLLALDLMGLAERTLVVLTADHGEGLGEHDERTHRYFVYDSTMRVPLVMRGPGVPVGRRVSALVQTIDIAPTVLDLLDIPPLEGVQGASLRPLFEGADRDPGRVAYGESIDLHAAFDASVLRFVREGRWKYIHKLEPELYDVVEDPREQRSLANEHPEIVERLRERLHEVVSSAPVATRGAEVAVDEETIRQLGALGYVEAAPAPRIEDEIATLEVRAPDASVAAADFHKIADGWGQLRDDDAEAAAVTFGLLLDRYPNSLPILRGSVAALRRLNRPDELTRVLERAIAADPDNAEFRRLLGQVAERAGDFDEAERGLRAAVAAEPCNVVPRSHLGRLLMEQGRCGEQIEMLAEAIEACGDVPGLLNDYAYALSTCTDDSKRDGAAALRLVTKIIEDGGSTNPSYLDTLAAAQAELGNFEEAAKTSRRALELLQTRNVPRAAVESFEKNLATIEAGRPIREGPRAEDS